MKPTKKAKSSTPQFVSSGIGMILIGIAVVALLGDRFDGFVDGLFKGFGVTLMLLGAYAASPLLRRRLQRRSNDGETKNSLWLPSEDEQK